MKEYTQGLLGVLIGLILIIATVVMKVKPNDEFRSWLTVTLGVLIICGCIVWWHLAYLFEVANGFGSLVLVSLLGLVGLIGFAAVVGYLQHKHHVQHGQRGQREPMANKCYSCERASQELGWKSKCFDCERQMNRTGDAEAEAEAATGSRMEYVLGFPSPFGVMGRP